MSTWPPCVLNSSVHGGFQQGCLEAVEFVASVLVMGPADTSVGVSLVARHVSRLGTDLHSRPTPWHDRAAPLPPLGVGDIGCCDVGWKETKGSEGKMGSAFSRSKKG